MAAKLGKNSLTGWLRIKPCGAGDECGAPAGLEHARALGHQGVNGADVVQHIDREEKIEGMVPEWQALAQAARPRAGDLFGACPPDHFARWFERGERASSPCRESAGVIAGARAELERAPARRGGE